MKLLALGNTIPAIALLAALGVLAPTALPAQDEAPAAQTTEKTDPAPPAATEGREFPQGRVARPEGAENRRGPRAMVRSVTYNNGDGTEVSRYFKLDMTGDGRVVETAAPGGEPLVKLDDAGNPIPANEIETAWLLGLIGFAQYEPPPATEPAAVEASEKAEDSRPGGRNARMRVVEGPDGRKYVLRGSPTIGLRETPAGPKGQIVVSVDNWAPSEEGWTKAPQPQWRQRQGRDRADESPQAEGESTEPAERRPRGDWQQRGERPRRERPQE